MNDFDEIFGGVGRDPRNDGLDFGGDDPNPGIFIYYCDFYRQQRIKPANARRRFELAECFLVTIIIFLLFYFLK